MGTEQDQLFYDDVYDAFRAVVAALGGYKTVGAKMWPAIDPNDAKSKLSHCLDKNRAEKLDLPEVLMLMRMGRAIGCHAAMTYIAGDTGYQATAVEPDDERAALQRQFIEATKAMQSLSARMERAGLLRAA